MKMEMRLFENHVFRRMPRKNERENKGRIEKTA
jgi:hypothetical protein